MASLRDETLADGTPVYRVRYRDNANGRAARTFTFYDEGDAEIFCSLVTRLGNRTPDLETLAQRGITLPDRGPGRPSVSARPVAAPADAGAAPVAALSVVEHVRAYLKTLPDRTEKPVVESTLDTYWSYFRSYIEPSPILRRTAAATVDEDDLTAWQRWVMAEKSAATAIDARKSVLSPALKWGRSKAGGRIRLDNPFEHVPRPEYMPAERPHFANPAAFVSWYRFLESVSPALADLAYFAVLTGTRGQEVRALTPGSMRDDKHMRAYQRWSKHVIRPGLKGGHSHRDIPLCPTAYDIFTRYADGRDRDELIFQHEGRSFDPYMWGKVWAQVRAAEDKARKAAAERGERPPSYLGTRGHAPRHTFKLAMDEDDVNAYVTRLVMGHKFSDVAGAYTHLTPRLAARVVAALEPWERLV